MYRVPQAGLTKPAVAGQLERGVRPHGTSRVASNRRNVRPYSFRVRYEMSVLENARPKRHPTWNLQCGSTEKMLRGASLNHKSDRIQRTGLYSATLCQNSLGTCSNRRKVSLSSVLILIGVAQGSLVDLLIVIFVERGLYSLSHFSSLSVCSEKR